jgi:arylformamidase
MIYDISRPLNDLLAVWPGDEPFSLTHSTDMEKGDLCTVGLLRSGLHCGTHVDAPFHFKADGKTIDELSLDIYCGIAAVVDAGLEELTSDLFESIDFTSVSRILVKTGIWNDNSVFPFEFPVLADGVPEYLSRHGVKLVGVDLPSVDKFNASVLKNHYALDAARIMIMESVDLSAVSPGVYELIALPLRIVGGDGSPVRAILRDLNVKEMEGNRRLGQ